MSASVRGQSNPMLMRSQQPISLERQTVKTAFAPGAAAKDAVARIAASEDLKRYTPPEIENAWGLAGSFDIYDCKPETIRDADAIRRFVYELCELIEMKRFGLSLIHI